jgi:hypothetical protein
MTYRVRRRRTRERAALSPADEFYLQTGHVIGDRTGRLSFAYKTDPTRAPDKDAASAAWREHEGEIRERMPEGLTPWAAIMFDGETGQSDPYAHLRVIP